MQLIFTVQKSMHQRIFWGFNIIPTTHKKASVRPLTEVEGRKERAEQSLGASSPHTGPPLMEHGGREGRKMVLQGNV